MLCLRVGMELKPGGDYCAVAWLGIKQGGAADLALSKVQKYAYHLWRSLITAASIFSLICSLAQVSFFEGSQSCC